MKLLIVESPNKIKKLREILGDSWDVGASVGHIRDLPKKDLAIDKQKGYMMTYEIYAEKEEVVEKLRYKVAQVGKENVFLATDADREGEAISFHLCKVLDLPIPEAKRVTFNEITRKAVLDAVDNPRKLDINLVAAQECRRCIDRLVGYEVSPVLWKFIKGHTGLSAGRVQTVAVRLVVEREREIAAFKDRYKFGVRGKFLTDNNETITGKLTNQSISEEKTASDFLEGCKQKKFTVGDVSVNEVLKQPGAPFSTSTLQQESFAKLKFPVKKTMELAQRLFENGLITYMRTDSVNLSEESIKEAENHIAKTYGQQYFNRRIFKNKSESAQEAHEAIRPTHFETIAAELGKDEDKLYQLIYNRTVASQMAAAKFQKTEIKIINDIDDIIFVSSASVLLFDGCLKAYMDEADEATDSKDEKDEDGEGETTLKFPINNEDRLVPTVMKATQSFDKPPSRYDEATIVKALEKKEIGRPSTYANTIGGIVAKQYVRTDSVTGKKQQVSILTLENGSIKKTTGTQSMGKEKNKLFSTEVGEIIIQFMEVHFAEIVDYGFTAKIESDFDLVAEKKATYVAVITAFDIGLQKQIEQTGGAVVVKVSERSLGLPCPKCEVGKIMDGKMKFHCSEEKLEKVIDKGEEKFENKGCAFAIWKTISGRTINEAEARELIEKRKTKLLKGFIGSKEKGSKPFGVHLILKADSTVGFLFDENKKPGTGKQSCSKPASAASMFGAKL